MAVVKLIKWAYDLTLQNPPTFCSGTLAKKTKCPQNNNLPKLNSILKIMLKTYAQAKLSKVQYFQTILGFFLSMTLSRCVWASLPPCILLQVCLGISSPLHPVCPFPFIICHETNAGINPGNLVHTLCAMG